MPTPPPPAPGAEVDTFTITNTEIDANGDVTIEVDTFADKNNANDITIVNTSTDPIDYIRVEKFGDNDNESDVIRIDLSEFDEDFTLDVRNTGNTVQDQLYLVGVQEFIDNSDGTFTATYFGTDSNLHTIQILPEESAVTAYYALDGLVTGEDGAEIMDDGYIDTQGDEIGDGDGEPDDVILGKGGSDTIFGGGGNDTIDGDYADLIGRLAPELPDYTFTGSPAGLAPGAEVDTFFITDAGIDANGEIIVEVDTFANKENPNDVTIVHGGTEAITLITVAKFGDGDGEADVIRFDLSTYDDDFGVVINNEDTFDTVVFEGVHTVTDNGDGTFDLSYTGTDLILHSVTVDADTAGVEFYLAADSPYFYDDVIDGGSGSDEMDGGYGDDNITGGAGADTLTGNIGADTIEGGDGADVIFGDWDQALIAEIAPGPTLTAEVDTFSIGDLEIDGGVVSIVVDQFADPNNENDVLITDDAANESIDLISLSKMGNGDNTDDVFRFDLSTFDDDFSINVNSEGIEDTFVFEDVYQAEDNGITWTITYYGEDDQLHIVEVTPGDAQVEIYYAPPPVSVLDPQTDDIITGGDGDDTLDGGYGDDDLDGGADDDNIRISTGTDTIAGGTGSDTYDASISTTLVDETINVTVDQSGDGTVAKTSDATTDTITSVETYVADEVDGQTDAITLTGVVDRGTISGLSDDAVGVFTPSGGGSPVAFGGVGEPTINDILSGTYDPGSGAMQPKGLYEITSGEEDGAQVGNISFSNFEQATFGVVCYAPETLIDTPFGQQRADTLCVGDLVETLDEGPCPVRWVRSNYHSLDGVPDQKSPVLIQAGALGDGLPAQDLIVSPQHRIFVGGHGQLDQVFNRESFIPAKALTVLPNVRYMRGKCDITWVHFALDKHHVVSANSLLSESLYLGPVAVSALTPGDQAVLRKIFGPVSRVGSAMNGPPARPFLTVGAAQRQMNLSGRSVSNHSKQHCNA